MFAFTSFISYLNNNNWGVQYGIKLYVLVIVSMICLLVGELIGRYVVLSKKEREHEIIHRRIEIPGAKNLLLIIIGIIFIILSIKNTVELALSAGYTGGYQILKYARWASHSETISHAKLLTFYKYFIIGVGYIYIYILINNIIFGGGWNKKDVKYLPVIFIFLGEIILSTSRADIILITQMVIFMYIIAWRIKNKWRIYPIGKFIFWGSISVVVFFAIFQYLGKFTGKTGIYSAWETFSIYAGSPIAAFSRWLETAASRNRKFGKETFWGLISLLNRFGFGIESVSLTKEFVVFNDGSETNIYTSLRHYYHDFGALGLFIIYLIKGILMTKFYIYIKKNNKFDLSVILYSYFAYDYIRQITAAEFLSMYFSISHMFTVLGIIVANKLIIPKRYYKVRNDINERSLKVDFN